MLDSTDTLTPVSKTDFGKRSAALRVELLNLQFDLREKQSLPVVLLIAGDDRQTTTSVIETLHEWMDARYLNSHFFGRPAEEEMERPRFWRYWRVLPSRGTVGVYVGAWPHGAIADRLKGKLDDEGWANRIANIATFEQQLVDQGCLVIKFWMHLPKAKLAKRLKKARKNPDAAWRVDDRDWKIHEKHGDLVKTANTLLEATHREGASWHVIPALDRRAAILRLGETLRDGLTDQVADKHSPSSPTIRVAPPTSTKRLRQIDLANHIDEASYKNSLRRCQAQIARRTERAAKNGWTSVLVFEGSDAAGKGGAIRRILHAMDLRDYRVVPVAAPSKDEIERHYLWRFWRALPRAGRLVIFDRSWYGRVLVERVENFASEEQWRRAYAEINDFERQLVDHGYLLQKFWLHIDADEQLRRFKARERTPFKKYKITDEDYRNREKGAAYAEAADEMFSRTDTFYAPWNLVAANDKRWARVQVLKAFADGLKAQAKRLRKRSS